MACVLCMNPIIDHHGGNVRSTKNVDFNADKRRSICAQGPILLEVEGFKTFLRMFRQWIGSERQGCTFILREMCLVRFGTVL